MWRHLLLGRKGPDCLQEFAAVVPSIKRREVQNRDFDSGLIFVVLLVQLELEVVVLENSSHQEVLEPRWIVLFQVQDVLNRGADKGKSFVVKSRREALECRVGQKSGLDDLLDVTIQIFVTLLAPVFPVVHVDHFLLAFLARVVTVGLDCNKVIS